jgi:hypothetical protein
MKKTNSVAWFNAFMLSTFIALLINSHLKAQNPSEIKKETVRGQYSIHTITKLNFLRPDLYNKAVDNQLGVIGNDFWGEEKLLNNRNPNNDVPNDGGLFDTPTDYFALNGNKTTLCGKTYTQEFSSGNVDDDLNLEIVCFPKDPVFQTNFSSIKDRSYSIYPWSMVEGEIDIDKNYHKYFDPNTPGFNIPPIKFKTDVCLYGPWVEEVYISSEDDNPTRDHIDNHEIHPSEQFWWAEKTQTGFKYCLNSANDASGRFLETGWSSNPLKNTFAIAFDILKPGKIKEKLVYNISIKSDQNVSPLSADGEKHYLVLGADTLVELDESHGKNILSVTFESVGLDPFSVSSSRSDTLIKGFVVIQTLLKTTDDKHGNLKLVIDKRVVTNLKSQVATVMPKINVIPENEQNRPDRIQEALRPHSVRVTLKEISTLENKLSIPQNKPFSAVPQFITVGFKLVGYIFVEKESTNLSFSKSSSQILEGKPQLLFPLAPGDKLSNTRVLFHNKDHRTSTYNNSITLSMHQGENINIVTDFLASYEPGKYIRTLELIEGEPYKEIKVKSSDLKKGQPKVEEIMLYNKERIPYADPKEYRMKIKIEFLMLD